MKKLSSTIIAFGLLVLAGISHAATVNIIPSGNNSFLVTGTNMAGATALDIFIDYDVATLTNPRTAAGPSSAGAMFAANTNIRGRILINIATLTPIKDGTIATITYDKKGSKPGRILKMTVDAHETKPDYQNTPLAVEAVVPEPSTTETVTDTGGGTSPSPSRHSSGGTGLVIAQTGDPQTSKETQTAPEKQPEMDKEVAPSIDRKEQSDRPEEADAAAKIAPEEKITWNPPAITSTLSRFKDFKGDRSVKNLLELFETKTSTVRQEPAVVLSDGVSKTTISMDLPNGKQAPNFAFDKATPVSIKQNGSTWVLTVLPNKNVSAATVIILFADHSLEFPIIVAPPVADLQAKKETLNEASFSRFLNARGTVKAPLGDLNKDGRRDYVDDYIYACNYLSATPPASGKALVK